jgi:hypothetical protein
MSSILAGLGAKSLDELPYDYEPELEERLFYRSRATGDKGFIVKRDGRLYVKLDRPNQEILRVYAEQDWIPAFDIRPLTRMALGQVAFEADRKLCFFLGLHEKSRREWLSLSDDQRIRWIKYGPVEKERRLLWESILKGLEGLTQ